MEIQKNMTPLKVMKTYMLTSQFEKCEEVNGACDELKLISIKENQSVQHKVLCGRQCKVNIRLR